MIPPVKRVPDAKFDNIPENYATEVMVRVLAALFFSVGKNLVYARYCGHIGNNYTNVLVQAVFFMMTETGVVHFKHLETPDDNGSKPKAPVWFTLGSSLRRLCHTV